MSLRLRETGSMCADIHYTSPDGLALYARSYGPEEAALTVLCMHGLTRNHKDFESMVSKLGNRYRFIAVDVRGRGRSAHDPNPANYTATVYAKDMIALLDHLKIKQVALIGTSMGGLMAMLMMKAAPERILGTVLNDIGPVVDPVGLNRITAYAAEVAPVADWQSAAEISAKAQTVVFPHYQSQDWMAFARRTYRQLADGRVILDYDPAIIRSIDESRPGWLAKFAMWRLYAVMKARPLMIIRGATSDILAKRTAALMVKRHRNAKFVEVPGTGHAPMLDTPLTVAAITQFLDDISASHTKSA